MSKLVQLTTAEGLLIRRALKMYAKQYDQMAHDKDPNKADWARKQDMQYAKAADALCDRLLRLVSPTQTAEMLAVEFGYNCSEQDGPEPDAFEVQENPNRRGTAMKVLTSSEKLLVRRALKFYAKQYDQMSHDTTKKQWERDQNLQYAQAADALCNDLLRGKTLANDEDFLGHVEAAINQYGMGKVAYDYEGWETAAKEIIEILSNPEKEVS